MTSATVVGAGAMGGLWAGRIAGAGHDVAIVDVSPALIEAVRAGGLTIEEGDAEITSRMVATAEPAAAGSRDIVFVFVKGPQTHGAAERMGSLLGPDTTVVSLQNGWGNADVIAEFVAPDRLVVGVTYEGAMIVSPGRVRHTGHGPTHLGPYVDGAPIERAEAVADLIRGAGFECVVTDRVKTDIWRKLIHNAACLPVAALTDLRAADLVEPGPACDLVDALATEAVAVARALGHDIEPGERIARIHTVLRNAGVGVPSMLADVHDRRPTEIATINGAVVRAAEVVGVPVPLNRAMVALVAGLEQSWARGGRCPT